MNARLFLCLVSVVLLVTVMPVGAQQASNKGGISVTDGVTPSPLVKGVHPLGSYAGGSFDTISLFNGSLNLTFPLASLNGRGGMGAGVVLSYNSNFWRVESTPVIQPGPSFPFPVYDDWDDNKPNLTPGFQLHAGRLIGRQSGYGKVGCTDQQQESQEYYAFTTTNLSFTAPDGTEYEFMDDKTKGTPQPFGDSLCPPVQNGFSRGRVFVTTDGTAATFISDQEIFDFVAPIGAPRVLKPSGTLLLRDGTRFRIRNGLVQEQQDRNGNRVEFFYRKDTRGEDTALLVLIKDTLGRFIDINYPGAGENLIVVTVRGVGQVERTTYVKRTALGNALQTGDSLKFYHELFPSPLFYPLNYKHNPQVINRIELPSGHAWNLTYNSYSEVVQLQTPVNGVVTYQMEPGTGPLPVQANAVLAHIFRRVAKRTVYPDGIIDSTPEGYTTYSDPSLKNPALPTGVPLPVLEQHFDGSTNVVLAKTEHEFSGSPLDSYYDTTQPGWIGGRPFRPWLEGKELRTTRINVTGGDNQTVRHVWQQAGPTWASPNDPTNPQQPQNNPRLTKATTIWQGAGRQSLTTVTEQDYDGFNNVIAERVFDFGSSGPGSLLRTVQREFVTQPIYTGSDLVHGNQNLDQILSQRPHLRSLVRKETVLGPQGEETTTAYTYDQYAEGLAFRPFPVVGHNPAYNQQKLLRGNATRIEQGLSTGSLTEVSLDFDVLGNVVKVTHPPTLDGKQKIISIEYSSEFHFAYPTQTEVPVGRQILSGSQQYDFATGFLLETQGYNGERTLFEYNDPLDRLTQVVRPAGQGTTEYAYSQAGDYPTTVTAVTDLDAGRQTTAVTEYDGVFRAFQQRRNDPDGEVFTITTFDGLGRTRMVTNPHRLTQTNAPTDSTTITGYDGLSRVISVETRTGLTGTGPSTGVVTTDYRLNEVTVTDQAGKQRRSVSDALGRVKTVWEPNSTGNLTLPTNYGYDARGNLKTVQQVDPEHSLTQQRTFSYDALGRLKSATVPESGLTNYEYDAASNLIQRTDARGRVTGFSYDELYRPVVKSYADGTPMARYFYEAYNPTGEPDLPSNPLPGATHLLGRMAAMITLPESRQNEEVSGKFYSYDIGGRVTNCVQVIGNTSFPSQASYNLASLPEAVTYPSGNRLTSTYNEAGQMATLNWRNQPLASVGSYTASGAVQEQQLGNGLTHRMDYNSRLQPVTIGLSSGGTPLWQLDYDYGLPGTGGGGFDPTKNNGNIHQITLTPGADTSPIQQEFVYDELNRLKRAVERFTPRPLPQLDSITPEMVTRSSTVQITLSGTNLAGVTELVLIPPGELSGKGITVSNLSSTATTVTATLTISATAALGDWGIQVITPLGTSNPVSFTVVDPEPQTPQITTLTPDQAERGTVFTLQLAGTNLTGAMDVIFTPPDGILISNLSGTATLVTVTVEIDPDVDPGERQVQVMTPAGLSNALPFTILAPAAPVIDELIPATARQGDTFTLVINGSNLADVSNLNFDSGQGINISNLSSTPTQVTATVEIQLNAEPGVQQVWVTTPAGDSNQLPFTITALDLAITSLNPNSAFQGTSFTLEIAGSDLTTVTGVNFVPSEGITVSNVSATATTVTATVSLDPGVNGDRQVTVTNGFAISNSLVFQLPDSCVMSGVVTAESGDMYGGDLARSTRRFLPRHVGAASTRASSLEWRGDRPYSGQVTIDLDLTQVDGEAELEATLGVGTSVGVQTLPAAVTATSSGSVSYPGGSAEVSITTTFDESAMITTTDGEVEVGGQSAGRTLVSRFVVEGGGHVTLTYTGSSSCSPSTALVSLGFQGEVLLVTCRALGSRTTQGKLTGYGKSATWRGGKPKTKPSTSSPGFQNPEPRTLNPEPQISWDQTFVYDRFGNLTETVEGGQGRSISVNAQNNRLNGPGMVYDAVGNLIEDNGKLYTYDAENRMLTATVNGVTTNYFYDGEGHRIKKIVNGQVTRFVYGMGGELIAEYEGATVNPLTPTKEYLYGATGLLAVSEGTTIKYLTPDHLGSTRVITDSTGQVVTRQDYYPFGREIEADKAQRGSLAGYGAVGGVRQKFTGYERDEETGLDFAQARYFANQIGRFISPDIPLVDQHLDIPQSWNLYTYVRNNPLRYFDDTGYEVKDIRLKNSGSNESKKKYSQEAGKIEELGPKALRGSFVFAVNIIVEFSPEDDPNNYEPVQTAFILYPKGENSDPLRPGVSDRLMPDNPEKDNVTRTDNQLIWYDNPGITTQGVPQAGVSGNYLALFTSTVKPKNEKKGQGTSTDKVLYWGVRLKVENGKIVTAIAEPISEEQYYELSKQKPPKNKKNN